MQGILLPERQCYCGKQYPTGSSFGRHSRGCPVFTSEDCKYLLRMLASLGTRPVPGDLFYRALFPFRSWNENGNETRRRVFELPGIFTDRDRLDKAFKDAITATAVWVTIGSSVPDADQGPSWAYMNFELPPDSRAFILTRCEPEDAWELHAARLVFHGFPIPDVDINFVEKGCIFLPFILPLLQRLPVEKLLVDEIPSMIEVCISISHFGDDQTKNQALTMAQNLADRIAPSPLNFGIHLRQLTLSMLKGQTVSCSLLPGTDRKGNSQRAEMLLLDAQQSIECGRVSAAWYFINQWIPFHAAQPSGLENTMSSRLEYMKGKLHRFQGDFETARLYFEPLSSQYPAPRVQFSSRLHLIAIYSELGLWEKAQALADKIKENAVTERQHRLYRLVQAELYLSRALCGCEDELTLGQDLFTDIVREYEGLVPFGKTMRRNFFRACFGLAAIGQLQRRGQPLFSAFTCLGGWQLAYLASRECLVTDEGFPDLVCHLSMAYAQWSVSGHLGPAIGKAEQVWATLSSRQLEQRFCFSNLGTRWVDTVSGWLETAGVPRIVPQYAHPAQTGVA
ncbi:hypothetical protein QBC43DRAFT_345968 [Cladorrhinum sp. PSN259]|nr:hypothetical protein QBC43DRAFT_345968 [Cladorrhinum sp. PSN259]